MTAATKRGFADVHQIYADLGWTGVLKLKAGTKWPPPAGFTGADGAYPSVADRHAWAEDEPDGNTAIRLADGFIGIDEDRYDGKTGQATIAEAENRWGSLPYSPKSTSRTDGSGIRIYRVPPGLRFASVIAFPELGLGDVEIIQPHHRYAVVWPSIHATTGDTYYWLDAEGAVTTPPNADDIPDLPEKWVQALREPEKPRDTAASGSEMPYNVRSALTEGEPSWRVAGKLGQAVAACAGSSRHDHVRDYVLALLRCGRDGEPGVQTALTQLRKVFVAAVGPDRAGGAEEARWEFDQFLDGKTATLLADDSYDLPPPHVTEVNADEFGEPEDDHEPTSWEPVDLGPWLTGARISPEPSVGISRSDGQKLIYPGKEHSVYGETEAGKSWFVLECAAVEMRMGRDVVYIHYEEGDPGSTIERLRLLGVTDDDIAAHLRFVAPARPSRPGWLTELLDPPPVLVIHDGVNEAMSLHGDDSMATDGAATFRRNLIKPCLAVGAATIACDHVTKSSEGRGRYAIGAGHKVAAIDGAAFMVENIEPFGRGLRGASSVYVTKDRPGQLRAHGKPTAIPGKTLIGVLAVDATGDSPDFLVLWAPKNDDGAQDAEGGKKAGHSLSEIGDMLHAIVAAEPDGTVKSRRDLFAKMRIAGNNFRHEVMRDAADILVVSGRLTEIPGRQGGTGYKVPPSASRLPIKNNPDTSASASASRTASPIGGDAVGRTRNGSASECRDAVGRTGTHSKPRRLKRSRAKGWRKPAGAVIVDRTSRWGNPYRVGIEAADNLDAVERFRRHLNSHPDLVEDIRKELAGRDLLCACEPGEPCHADVLIEVANQ